MSSRGTVTLAFGKPRYLEMAKSLARSLFLHDPTLMRAIITDSDDPELGELFTYRIALRPEYGPASGQMLHLDRYTPFDQTLFIDCDSLAVRSLDHFFTAFHPVPFGVCSALALDSAESADSHDSLDVPFLLDRFHLASVPRFNGAVFYFNHTPAATALFTTARDLLANASDLHLRAATISSTTHTSLFALAMAIHNLSPTDMGRAGMWTTMDASIRLALDIPHSICTIVQRRGVQLPDILHLSQFTESLFYLRECSRLELLAHGESDDLTVAQELQLISTATILWARRRAESLLHRLENLLSTFPTLNPRSASSLNVRPLVVSAERPHHA
jgi:hypothetical protein